MSENLGDFVKSRSVEEVASFAGINTDDTLYRQDITEKECAECGEEKQLTYVMPNEIAFVCCTSCYMDLVPRERTKYVRIDSLPLRKNSILDILVNDDGEDEEDEDFQLDDSDELEDMDNPSNSAHI